MTARDDLRDFLTARRARVTPAAAGLPVADVKRRVPGLRREEVATLAGISVEYYIRLERGTPGQVSDEVLDAVGRALQLDLDEHDHLVRLVRSAAPRGASARRREGRRTTRVDTVRPTVRRLLDLMPTPAYVRNARFDLVAANRLGVALYRPVYESVTVGDHRPNTARFAFLDPSAGDFFVDLDQVRDDAVAFLHDEAARSPYDRDLTALIGELSTRSEPFRMLWAEQNVRAHRTGTKALRHPLVGPLVLDFDALDVLGADGLRLNVYTAEPGSPADEGLQLLASWEGEVTTHP